VAPELIPALARGAIAVYACALAPGQGWWRGRQSSLPRLWAQVLVSVLCTTAVASSLAAFESFSLASVVLGNGFITFVGFLYQLLIRGRDESIPVWHDRIGPLVFLLALLAYWPPYPTFLAASDASAYLDTGVALARTGKFAVDDELAPRLSPILRRSLFDSMSQVVGGGGPPYRRVPGALLMHSLEDTRAWPAFFPVPSVWAALVTEIAGARAAPAYATFFAALAVWTTFVLVRRWLTLPWTLLAVAVIAGNGAAYYSAHFAMSEQPAWYLAWAGLTAAAAYDHKRGHADIVLAAAAFGAAMLLRIDFAIFLAGTLVLLPSFRAAATASSESTAAPLPPAFFAMIGAWALLTAVELVRVPGSYAAPLLDNGTNARVLLLYLLVHHATLLAVGAVAASIAAAALAWWLGWRRALRFGFVLALVAGHAAVSSFLATRTPLWLSFYMGWAGLALAAAGTVIVWQRRRELPGSAMVLALLAVTSLVLFYNPHVHPTLPWGVRRYVPVLLPGLLLLAVAAAEHAWRRHPAAGVIAVAALLFGVVAGGRTVWGKPLYQGATEQLEEVVAAIPDGGLIAINRTLSAHMLGPALWLLYGRNNVSVYPDTTKVGRQQLSALVHAFPNVPVYFVTGGFGRPQPAAFVRGSLVGRTRVHLPLLEATHDRLPVRIERYLAPIAIYKLERSLNGKGEPIR